ncbi:MAG: DNA polymerase III subunit gamma/tau [Acidobacteriaceae bacterium]
MTVRTPATTAKETLQSSFRPVAVLTPMAYQVLARKYRPQKFSDVVGQDHVTRTLINALSQGRVAHGYIFSGHRGIGKTTIARIVAMALNCQRTIGSEERPTPEPCGSCDNCREISAASRSDVSIFEESHNFDVEEIDAATRRGIDDAKLLTSKILTRPSNKSKYKILILDEAHQITDAAWNALLKTLEEPPEWAVFMFATTQPEDIPQTVRSRCQHFSFHAVKLEDILGQLRMVCEKENVRADEAALSLLGEAGDGSMRDALSIMDQAIASAPLVDGQPLLEAAQIRELMGTVPNAVFEQIMEAISANQTATVVTETNRLLDAGNSPAQLARQFVRYLRNCLIAKIAGITPDNDATELLQLSPDERKRSARSAMLFSEEDIARFLQVMLRTFDELGYRQEQRFHFELGLIKLVHLQRLLPVEELLSAVPLPLSSRPSERRTGPLPAASTPPAQRPASTPPAATSSPATAAQRPSTPAVSAPADAVPTVSSPNVSAPNVSAPSISPFESDSNRKSSGSRSPLSETATDASNDNAPRGMATSSATPIASADAVPQPIATAGRAPVASAAPLASTTASYADTTHGALALALAEEPLAKTLEAPNVVANDSGLDLEALQNAVCDALASNGQQSMADQMGEATWSVDAGQLTVQTTVGKAVLGLLFTAAAEKISREALRANGGGALKLTLLPGSANSAAAPKKTRAPRTGSAQARAMEHPMVQQAQRLFNAEVRNVIDLREKD